MTHPDRYASYAELSASEIEGRDYRRVIVRKLTSAIAVIAPHGGGIERWTSEIARAIAGDDFNLYLFEGIKSKNNRDLHITSRRFDEPRCLGLVAECDVVVAVHGCIADDERVLLGGLDATLKTEIAQALFDVGLTVETDGHRFPAVDKNNICNRGRTGRGIQLEISGVLRCGSKALKVVQAVRGALGLGRAAV
jgi:phage replication-related protein YjqB (UPF0714/DUF867 family)